MNILDQDVLVLNKNWHWIAMAPVRDAITKMMSIDDDGYRALAVDSDYITYDFDEWLKQPTGDRAIKTSKRMIPAPEIIIMCRYNEVPRHSVRWARVRVLKRDRLTCQYCGVQPGMSLLTIDHVLPTSRGGKTSWDNTVACCSECNAKKADRLPREVGMKLKKIPGVPFASLVAHVESRKDVLPSWIPFIKSK